jgi:predicted transcriptional regulator
MVFSLNFGENPYYYLLMNMFSLFYSGVNPVGVANPGEIYSPNFGENHGKKYWKKLSEIWGSDLQMSVVSYFMHVKATSQNEITRETGVKETTVLRLLKSLKWMGVIQIRKKLPSLAEDGGRPVIVYAIKGTPVKIVDEGIKRTRKIQDEEGKQRLEDKKVDKIQEKRDIEARIREAQEQRYASENADTRAAMSLWNEYNVDGDKTPDKVFRRWLFDEKRLDTDTSTRYLVIIVDQLQKVVKS